MSIYNIIYSNLCAKGKLLKEHHKKGSNIHQHHIIPKHMGGLDNEDNYTYLTIREHIIAHFLLWKIHKNPNDLRSMYMLGENLTYEQRKIVGIWCKENKIGFHGATKEEFGAWGKKGIESQEKQNLKNSFWWWQTKEGIRERASKGGKQASILKVNVDRIWINKNGISKRIKSFDVDEYLKDDWKIGVGYSKSEKEICGTKERANVKVVCPHCKKEGQKIVMYKHHFDRCKKIYK